MSKKKKKKKKREKKREEDYYYNNNNNGANNNNNDYGDNNNNVHLSCAHQRPERPHDTDYPKYNILYICRAPTQTVSVSLSK